MMVAFFVGLFVGLIFGMVIQWVSGQAEQR